MQPNAHSPKETFLVDGIRLYLDAKSAILHYESEVQNICRRVMEGYLAQYADALGFALKLDEIQPYSWPPVKDWDGSGTSLGAIVKKLEPTQGMGQWEAYCCLEWEREGAQCWCCVGEWFNTQKLAQAAYEKIQKVDPEIVEIYGRSVLAYELISPNEAPAMEEKLKPLAHRWIKIWKSVGGMMKILKSAKT